MHRTDRQAEPRATVQAPRAISWPPPPAEPPPPHPPVARSSKGRARRDRLATDIPARGCQSARRRYPAPSAVATLAPAGRICPDSGSSSPHSSPINRSADNLVRTEQGAAPVPTAARQRAESTGRHQRPQADRGFETASAWRPNCPALQSISDPKAGLFILSDPTRGHDSKPDEPGSRHDQRKPTGGRA